MEATHATIGLMDQVKDLITADDLRLFLYTCGMALAGAIVNKCFVKHDTFKESVNNFFGSMIFGIMAGTMFLIIYNKIAYIIAGVCSLFAKPTYQLLEKVLPKKMADRATKILD